MSIIIFLTVVQVIIAVALVGVILMQRSEGGGLGVGGSPAGLMSARGAADFLTRATAILATLFVVLSITLASLAVSETSGRKIDQSLDRSSTGPAPASDPVSAGQKPSAAPPAAKDPIEGAAKK
jgi:preprotein translocase subunit SecG